MGGEPWTVQRKLVRRRAAKAAPEKPAPPAIPRIARLMACAIVFDEMLARGEVRSYRELAAIGQVSTARISQVMGLLDLAPGIQEELLQTRASAHADSATVRQVRHITKTTDWDQQRRPSQSLPCQRPPEREPTLRQTPTWSDTSRARSRP